MVSDNFQFYKKQAPAYFNEVFCPVDNNGAAMRSCNKKLRLSFSLVEIKNCHVYRM